MSTQIEVSFPATSSGLVSALATIDQFRALRNLGADETARVRIVAEELISNTIKYGYGGECDRRIWLRLDHEPVLTLTYDDEADPFDPTLWRPDEEWTVVSRERHEGRSGIALLQALSSSVAYHPRPGGNRLVVTFSPR
jgi:serine/threonine-protein kinase RsbW